MWMWQQVTMLTAIVVYMSLGKLQQPPVCDDRGMMLDDDKCIFFTDETETSMSSIRTEQSFNSLSTENVIDCSFLDADCWSKMF